MPASAKRKIPTKTSPSVKPAAVPAAPAPAPVSRPAGETVQELKAAILNHLKFTQARDQHTATKRDWWICTCLTVRDRLLERMIRTQGVHNDGNLRRMYYLSLEYLMGRLLMNNLYSADIYADTVTALREIGQDPEIILEEEHDMGLGNGGLGRLAACFLDSLATLDLPAIGYGIHYEFGLFRQDFVNGHQIEHPDNWLVHGAPWEIERPEYSEAVQVYGHVETRFDNLGRAHQRWVNARSVIGVPYDIPIAGYGTNTVNFLRLWASRASQDFDLAAFNKGGYVEAVRDKAIGETFSKVLYPNDKTESGKELRLVQQYFFITCSLRDIIRRYRKANTGWDNFSAKVAIQLNDTHPSIAIVELMRILLDEEGMSFDQAWAIVTRTFAYTNHTLMPEALERWSVPLLKKVLPRHLQIIFDINQHHMETVELRWPGDNEKKRVCSIIEEDHVQNVRMAHLSVVASHSVNGVAALHTELLQKNLFPEFAELFPGRFNNKTNGITPRRWLRACNPRLSALIDSKIGPGWTRNLDELRRLEKWAGEAKFQADFMAAKRENKVELADIIRRLCGVEVSPDALFDVHVKRLHEYKRQHLNLIHILALYRRLVKNPDLDVVPRVFIFAAKAAPGYDLAKAIIKAANSMAKVINHDERIKGKLKIVFLPNYGVSLAEKIIPAADVSEQISTAGKEASGTGNMKLALNGAVTVGTLDGANVEIGEEVGADNIFIFGMTVDEVNALHARGYNPWDYFHRNEELRGALDWLGSGYFTPEDPNVLGGLRYSLLDGGDPFLVLADFESYCAIHEKVDAAYRDTKRWAKMAILNTARVGKFSSDRTIAEYNRDIWQLAPAPVP